MLSRRWPIYTRAIPFLLGLIAFLLGVYFGPAWIWDWSLQTGNVFLSLTIPVQFFAFDPAHLSWLVVGAAGLIVMFVPGLLGRAKAERVAVGKAAVFGPAGRFFPLTFLFALFAIYYGILFLANASVGGDAPQGGVVVFLYLNYDGIFDRPVTSVLGAIVLCIGLLALRSSFSFGLGDFGVRQTQAKRMLIAVAAKDTRAGPLP